MKKLLLLLMIVPMIGFGQTRKSAVISATNMNVLYQQVENPISVAVPEVKLSEISVEINNGTITKQSDGNYTVIPVKSGKATITVYVNTKKGKVKYGLMDFRVREVPPPNAYIQGATRRDDGSIFISKSELIGAQMLQVELKDFPFDRRAVSYKVVEYNFRITIDAETYNVENIGMVFNKKIQSLIKKAPNGTQITFDRIKVKRRNCKTCKTNNVPPISLTIEW